MEITLSSTLSPKNSVSARALGNEILLLNEETGEHFGLNEVGTVLWHGIEAGASLSAIAATVATTFDVSPETSERDLITLATELVRRGLVLVR